jgi:ABC-2 type transport system ATP-binding protein
MPDAIVQITNLTHAYGDRIALRNLNLSIAPASIFGFLGPNGSGKTTLFRILSTLIPLRDGSINLLGLDLKTQRDLIRRQIGIVFQAASLDKQLTAEENLRHQGHLYGLSGPALEQRIDEMLSRVGLSERPREYVSTFSGGMRRRVELAKGLLHRPRILLLDEPSTGLDPGARIDLWKYLLEIRERDGVTILVTTHLMDEAEHCDRLAILDHGQLIATGTPAALKEQIGGDIITLTTPDAPSLQRAIRDKFQIEPIAVDNSLRIERDRGHEFIPQLVEAFPGLIRSISLGKPTLEDVFVRATGRRFEDESSADSNPLRQT